MVVNLSMTYNKSSLVKDVGSLSTESEFERLSSVPVSDEWWPGSRVFLSGLYIWNDKGFD